MPCSNPVRNASSALTAVRMATSLLIEATAMLRFHNAASGCAIDRSDASFFMFCIA